jgi:hypothetical protein
VLQLRTRFPDASRWEAVVVVSNMRTLRVMRVVLTDDAFVVYSTDDEPMLPHPQPPGPSGPPPLPRGVELLARVLCASPSQLGGMLCCPADEIQVTPLTRRGTRGTRAETVTIGTLLGSGGFCDVFAGSWRGAAVAVKLPRHSTDKQSLAALCAELTALRKLARTPLPSPHVPTLAGVSLERDSTQPALVLQPAGVDATRAPGAAAAPGSLERRQLAHACADGVFAALRAAHAANVLHRDVRPTNVLWHESESRALLIDWGIARSAKATLRALQPGALGWPDAAPDAALLASSGAGAPWLPCAATDCESAVYTLAALAFGVPCGEPPWASSSATMASAAALAAAASVAAHGPAAVASAVATVVVAARLRARDEWFATLPHAHPLRVARASAQAAQDGLGSSHPPLPPYSLPLGWAVLP